jgi:hypothetical protein
MEHWWRVLIMGAEDTQSLYLSVSFAMNLKLLEKVY